MAWWRDLVIIVAGLGVTIVAIIIAVIAFMLYRNLRAATESMKATAAKIEALTTFAVDEVAKPLIQVASIIQGVTQGINTVKKMFGKGGEGNERG